MVFSSGVFLLLFLPIAIAIYYNPVVKNREFRNNWLLIVSLFFYAWGEPRFVMIMMASVVLNWAAARLMDHCRKERNKRVLLIVLLILNLGLLFIYKYLNFTLENINRVFHGHIRLTALVLPVGISFFTFQMLSYVLDVYRGKVQASKSLTKVALYAMMFPQLVAGPIVRYSSIYESICERQENREDFVYGIRRFVIGLGKKVILADLLAKIADEVFLASDSVEGVTVLLVWIGALAYTFQIYFDFSGYSDMAIGLGRCFGFNFDENFNYPYIASSITDFWKRWHISLTSWFRDYVYIPLGGNRCSDVRHCFNLFVVWMLTGVWHGANWTFIIWGIIYFVLQFFEKKIMPAHKVGKWGHIYTMFWVMICWVIFKSDSVTSAFHYIMKMFGVGVPMLDETAVRTLRGAWVLLVVSGLACLPWNNMQIIRKIPRMAQEVLRQMAVIVIFIVSLLSVINGNYRPFVYFNF